MLAAATTSSATVSAVARVAPGRVARVARPAPARVSSTRRLACRAHDDDARAGPRADQDDYVIPAMTVDEEMDSWMTREMPPPPTSLADDADVSSSAPPTSRPAEIPDENSADDARELAAVLDDVLHDRDDVPDGADAVTRAPRAPAQPIDERAEDDARATPSTPSFASWARRLAERVFTGADSRARARSAADALRALDQARASLPMDLTAAIRRGVESTAASRSSVGWLLRDDATRAASDGTARFETLLAAARRPGGVDAARASRGPGFESHRTVEREANHTLDASSASVTASSAVMRDGPAYLLVPGLYGRYYPCYMWGVRDHFRSRGAVVKISSAVDGEGTVLRNAASLRREILAYHRETGGKRVVLVGHSKGAADAAAALALYESELSGVVRGLVASQCPYGGSPIASDLLAFPALEKLTARALESLVGLPAGEGAKTLVPPMRDVSYAARRAFVSRHPLPRTFPCVSFHTATSSRASFLHLSAAYVRRRYDAANDGLVARCDAEIPGSVAVRWSAEQDHADCVYPRRVDAAALDADRSETARAAKEAAALEEKEAAALASDEEKDARRGGKRDGARDFDAFDGRSVDEHMDENGLVPLAVAKELARRRRSEEDADAVVAASGSDPDPNPRPMPPAVGPLIVRAYAALNDALPDRLRGVAEPGEYHEALVALLLEQEQPRKSGVESGVESARRREDDERVEECLGE